MKRIILGALALFLLSLAGPSALIASTYAEEESQSAPSGTSISLEPSSKTLQINSNSVYDGSFNFKNDGDKEIQVEVYAAPYSYVYSNEDDLYKLGFTNENNFTQISRWITIQDQNDTYVEKPVFTVPANGTVEIKYRVTTPNNIPAGGQYAVIFVRTMGGPISASGIRTEASAGMILYGHSLEGEAVISAEIRDLAISQGSIDQGSSKNNFYATAKVKNTGNVDFNAVGKLKVEPILGSSSYETASGVVSVIPESERVIQDEWQETPDFGIYKITWTITAGSETDTVEKTIFLIPVWLIILTITLLTIIIIWIIIGVRKRRERSSRLAV